MQNTVYEIMHMNRRVAIIDTSGRCKIYYKSFMPYNLYMGEDDDIDTLINNITNFYYWCSTRMLTLDRKYAKEIMNSIGAKQTVSDKERAQIALMYRCASLTDVFWVKEKKEKITFEEINLYDNHLSNAFIDISLRGKQYTVNNTELARDLGTNGLFPKAWRRIENGFELLKNGGEEIVDKEVLASRICRCFRMNQVLYEYGEFDGEKVSISKNITSKEFSIVPMEFFEIYSGNHGRDTKKYVYDLDKHNYHMMNIVDYLVGNTDRHWGNWGVLVKNSNNKPVRLYDLMDFNQSFNSYESEDGANCMTMFGRRISQKDAAIIAVKTIGLNQISDIEAEVFDKLPQFKDMFKIRFDILKQYEEY